MADLQIQLDQQRAAQAAATNAAATNAVNAVETLPLPAFWPLAPEDWFAVIEAVFVTRRITNERTRYMHVLQKLPPETVASVRDVIRQVDTLAAPYTRLKEKLTNTYGKSKYQLCDELFDMPPLGAEKPSILMAKMLALVPDGDTVGTWFLALFLRRLPEWMRRQLKAGGYTNPDELSIAADELWEDRGGAISAVQPPGNGGNNGGSSHKSRSKSKSGKNNWRQKSPSRSRSPSPGRRFMRDHPAGHRNCVYHWTFGNKATKCRPPCAWTPQGN